MRFLPALTLLTLACKPTATTGTPESDTDTDTDTDADADIVPHPDHYAFPSRSDASIDSVSYGGQVFRQLLIDDLKEHLGGLTERLDNGYFPVAGDVEAELLFYLEFDSASAGSLDHLQALTPAALQPTYDDVSSDKDLFGKLAGNDPVGQHKDWTTELIGWPSASSPEGLVRDWVSVVDTAAVDWSTGTYPLRPDGTPVAAVYVTAEGHDLQQLLQKFLRGGIAYSQGTDDYLDDDEAGKGLNSDHTALEEGKPYTALEHAWDEGFGYFGASRTYAVWSDDQIAARSRDVDADGATDLLREVCWGHSINAAKRDLGAVTATDYTQQAWQGFFEGRLLLSDTSAALSPAELDSLRGHRDVAVEAWEKALVATVIHYINDTVADMESSTTAFEDHAKHWSELKGFALGLQFNPHSPITDAQLQSLHDAIGTAPVLSTAPQQERDEHVAALLAARAMLGTALELPSANLGDDHGQNGW